MNASLLRIHLRPRTPLESVDLALRLLWEEVWPVARLAGLVLAPLAIALALAMFVVRQAPDQAEARAVLLAFTLLVCPLLQVPFTLLLGRRLFDPTVTAWGAVSDVPSAWGVALLTTVVSVVGLVLGGCSAGLLWLPLQVATLWVVEVGALEGKGIAGTLRRTRELALDGLGHTLLAVVLLAALYVWVVLSAEFGGQAFVSFVLQLGEPFGALTSGDVTPFLLFGVLVAQPLVAVCRLVLWLDLRSAIEGWDIHVQLLAAREGE